jgi:hypothetical protein
MCLTWAQINQFGVKNKKAVHSPQSIVHGTRLPIVNCLLPILILLLLSCGKALPSLENVNLQDWKNDRKGCSGLRLSMKESFTSQKDKLLSLTETDMIKLLGKSDETELYKRSEKFYKYYFNGGPSCAKDSVQASFMIIRFNAMNLAKEVVIE